MIGNADDIKTLCAQYGIPQNGCDALIEYLVHRVPPGSFFKALLENDFVEIFRTADEGNRRALIGYANLMYNDLPGRTYGPGVCPYGSVENVRAWLAGPKEPGRAEHHPE